MKLLIATAKGPGNNFDEICKAIRLSAEGNELKVTSGILWTNGPVCTNLAFELEGPDKQAEALANWLTHELMPAKWSTTQDKLPEHDTNEVEPMP